MASTTKAAALAGRTALRNGPLATQPASTSALNGRAVRIKIHPRPSSLRASSEILRVLQRYGDVEMFKNLKYDRDAAAPNTCLAIFEQRQAAVRLLEGSPVRVSFGVEGEGEGGGWVGGVEEVAGGLDLGGVGEYQDAGGVARGWKDEVVARAEQDGKMDEGSPAHEAEEETTFRREDTEVREPLFSASAWGQTFARASSVQDPPPPQKAPPPTPSKTRTSFLASILKSDPPPSSPHTTTSSLPTSTHPPEPTPQQSQSQTYTLLISPSHISHPLYTARQPYYGPYTPNAAFPYSPYHQHPNPHRKVGLMGEPRPSRIKRRFREEAEARGSLEGLWRKGMERVRKGEGDAR